MILFLFGNHNASRDTNSFHQNFIDALRFPSYAISFDLASHSPSPSILSLSLLFTFLPKEINSSCRPFFRIREFVLYGKLDSCRARGGRERGRKTVRWHDNYIAVSETTDRWNIDERTGGRWWIRIMHRVHTRKNTYTQRERETRAITIWPRSDNNGAYLVT